MSICLIATNVRSGRTYRVDSATLPDSFKEPYLAVIAKMNGPIEKNVNGNWSFGVHQTQGTRDGIPFQQKAAELFAARWNAVNGDAVWSEADTARRVAEALQEA